MTDIDRSVPYVETHYHLWEHDRFSYPWQMSPGGDLDGFRLMQHDWGPARLYREFYGQNVVKAVHIEAGYDGPDPVAETVWIDEVAGDFGMPNAIVVPADLTRDDAEVQLDRHLEVSSRVRGVRAYAIPDDPAAGPFLNNYRALGARGLSYESTAAPGTLLKTRDLAAANPDVPVILGHTGSPTVNDPDQFALWRKELTALAEVPNVVCKISGLGMKDHQWSIESIRPCVLHAIDAFGPGRAMFGTNWPVDLIFAPFIEQVDAYRSILAAEGFKPDEQHQLLHATAERVYGI